MVVFTCNHCGDSLQKPKVAKHYQTTCSRNPISLTCVDCFKDFNLQEYEVHIKCVTEEDRYSAKGTALKVVKGEVKQTEWITTVNQIIEQQKNVKPGVKFILESMAKYNNIPRKKPKFINFVSSSFGRKLSSRDVEEVWNLLEAHKSAEKKNKTEDNETNGHKLKNGDGETKASESKDDAKEIKKLKKTKKSKSEQVAITETNETEEKITKKKRKSKQKVSVSNETEEIPGKKQKLTEIIEEIEVESISKKKKKKKSISEDNKIEETPQKGNETIDTNSLDNKGSKKKTKEHEKTKLEESQNGKASEIFSFKQAILEILKKKSKGISKEALQNKVLKKYKATQGPIEDKELLLKKYNKKLKSIKSMISDNDIYKLIE